MRLHFEDEENTEEEPGGDIPGLCFVIAFRDFFRSDREGPLGVTRILRPVACRLRFSLVILFPQVDCTQEKENVYYFCCLAIHLHRSASFAARKSECER